MERQQGFSGRLALSTLGPSRALTLEPLIMIIARLRPNYHLLTGHAVSKINFVGQKATLCILATTVSCLV